MHDRDDHGGAVRSTRLASTAAPCCSLPTPSRRRSPQQVFHRRPLIAAWSFGRGRARRAAVRKRGHQVRPLHVEVALRLAEGGVCPRYTRAVPVVEPSDGLMRTVEGCVQWLASPKRPPGIDPAQGKLTPRRAERKRQQVANLLMACQACLLPFLERQRRHRRQGNCADDDDAVGQVIEFCFGTGHVGLPLALLNPSIHVLLLDASPTHIAIAQERVRAAGLSGRVACQLGTVQDFLRDQQQQQQGGNGGDAFQLGIALHACGPLTDLSMEAMLRARAAFVLCPCCVGKIKHAPPSLAYPRSEQVRQALLPSLTPTHDYAALASAADVSVRSFSASASSVPGVVDEGLVRRGDGGDGSSDSHAHRQRQRQRRLCKSFVETDRCLRAEEQGYRTWMTLLMPRECTPKNDLLWGYPMEWEEVGLGRMREQEEEPGLSDSVVVSLLEGGGPIESEAPAAAAAAFDAWFGDEPVVGEGGGSEGEEEEEEEEKQAGCGEPHTM